MSLFLPNCTGFTKKSHYGLYGLNQKLIKKPHPISLIDLKPKTEKKSHYGLYGLIQKILNK